MQLQELLNQADIICAHLIYVVVSLGLHAFGIYVHNDTMQCLGRAEDTFNDNSIQLKPIFTSLLSPNSCLSTADFMVHHIHAFTIHTTVLILVKAVLYTKSSRLVSDKLELSFRYPCDGPGRGGTCQISSWDHMFLGVFWMYNNLSIVLFHYFWKMQSDIWQLSNGDWSLNSTTINGWLRNFLWSQASQVIQAYGTSYSILAFIFLSSHFIWAFSLMFLYSGRGYWQELIESILWAHYKIKVIPSIEPRALSITQGRAVGLAHYILGGIATTWSFFISRMVALS